MKYLDENKVEELRLELFEKVNQLGIGAQGLGGLTTVLDIKIMDFPTHAASKPVASLPSAAALAGPYGSVLPAREQYVASGV